MERENEVERERVSFNGVEAGRAIEPRDKAISGFMSSALAEKADA